jgi:ferredoxin
MWQGYGHFQTLLKGLEGYMEAEKLGSLTQIRGKALPHITTIDEVSKRPPLISQVDPEKCTNLKKGGCELCGKVCFYGAIEFSPRLNDRRSATGATCAWSYAPWEALGWGRRRQTHSPQDLEGAGNMFI